jgi:hypothetical protein
MLVNDEQFEIQTTVLRSGIENCLTVGYPARLHCIGFMDFIRAYTGLFIDAL